MDLQTLRALEDALINFQGAILLVTHDRSFLDRACNSILSFEEGKVVAYSDRHQVILARKARAAAKAAQGSEKKTKMAKPKKIELKVLSYKEKQELATLPENIEAKETRLEEINQILGKPDSYSNPKVDIVSLQKEVKTLEDETLEAMERWEELSERE